MPFQIRYLKKQTNKFAARVLYVTYPSNLMALPQCEEIPSIIIHGVLYTLNIAKPAFIYVITSFISFNYILIVKKISTSKFMT